jgi:hypothetical protein
MRPKRLSRSIRIATGRLQPTKSDLNSEDRLAAVGGGGRPGGRSDGNESLGALRIGSQLPDITVFDENGKELSTRDLRGKHTVLVFGCLT